MTRVVLCKFAVALALLGLMDTVLSHHYQKWRVLGKDAFVADAAARFDKYTAAPSGPIVVMIVATALGFLVWASYEGCVALLIKLTKKTSAT